MAEISKSILEIQRIFRLVVCEIWGIAYEQSYSRIRFPWGSQVDTPGGTGSAPDWTRDEDVCFIYALPHDNSYNRQRDRRYEHRGSRDLVALDEHTDVHHMMFSNYGPNAYDCARRIRDGLFLDETRRILKQNHFAIITDTPAIRRVPELVNGEWWNRVDAVAAFNEFVRLESKMRTFERFPFTVSSPGRAGYLQGGAEVSRKQHPRKEEE